MVRIRNWDVKLFEWMRKVDGKKFKWGKTDCGSLAKQAIITMYDDDTVGDDLDSYTTKTEALRTLSSIGSIEDRLMEMGGVEHPITFAQQGDFIVGPQVGDEVFPGISVVVAGKGIIANEDSGIYTVPIGMFNKKLTVIRLPNG